MRPSAQQLYPILALLVLAGGTVWLDRATREAPVRERDAARTEPDFIADRARLTNFDRNGALRYELDADRITHYATAGTTELQQPRLRYLGENRELRVTAQHGTVSENGDEVFLAGAVRAERDGTPGSAPMTFASETLKIWPDDERAETRDPVVLTQGATVARALGLKTDNLFGTLDLLGDVRVHLPRNARTRP